MDQDSEARLVAQLTPLQARYRSFWLRDPLIVAGIVCCLGFLPLVYALFISDYVSAGLGNVSLLVQQDAAPADSDPASARPALALTDARGCELTSRQAAPTGGGEPAVDPRRPWLMCDGQPVAQFRIKEVGYVHALNWSLVLAVVFPVAVFFAFKSIQAFRPILARMQNNGQFTDAQLNPDKADITPLAALAWKRALRLGVGAFAIGFLVTMVDYLQVVAQPYCAEADWCHETFYSDAAEDAAAGAAGPEAGGERGRILFAPHLRPFAYEYDWSISAVFDTAYQLHYPRLAACLGDAGPGGGCTISHDVADLLGGQGGGQDGGQSAIENALFAFYVYLLLALLIGLTLAFYGTVLGIGWTFESLARDQFDETAVGARRFNLLVLPNLRSQDPRYGFQYFARFLGCLMLATLVNYFMLYLMRVQNLYLRDHGYSSIIEFLVRDIVEPIRNFFVGGSEFLSVWITQGLEAAKEQLQPLIREAGESTALGDLVNVFDPGLNDPQAHLSVLVLLVVYAVISGLFIAALNDLARHARDNVREMLEEPSLAPRIAAYYGLTQEETGTRLAKMSIWPVAWPNLQSLLRFLAVGILFLVFYRIWIIWLAAILVSFLRGRGLTDSER